MNTASQRSAPQLTGHTTHPCQADDRSYVTALHAKIPLTLHDPSPNVLSSALKRLDGLLARDVEKGRLSRDEAEAARGRVKVVEGDATEKGLVGNTDLVIEVGVHRLCAGLALNDWDRRFQKYRS
jgi:hypothetical protein